MNNWMLNLYLFIKQLKNKILMYKLWLNWFIILILNFSKTKKIKFKNMI